MASWCFPLARYAEARENFSSNRVGSAAIIFSNSSGFASVSPPNCSNKSRAEIADFTAAWSKHVLNRDFKLLTKSLATEAFPWSFKIYGWPNHIIENFTCFKTHWINPDSAIAPFVSFSRSWSSYTSPNNFDASSNFPSWSNDSAVARVASESLSPTTSARASRKALYLQRESRWEMGPNQQVLKETFSHLEHQRMTKWDVLQKRKSQLERIESSILMQGIVPCPHQACQDEQHLNSRRWIFIPESKSKKFSPLNILISFSKRGPNCLHGLHQLAVQYNTTGLFELITLGRIFNAETYGMNWSHSPILKENENKPQIQHHQLGQSNMSKMEERADCVTKMERKQQENGVWNK